MNKQDMFLISDLIPVQMKGACAAEGTRASPLMIQQWSQLWCMTALCGTAITLIQFLSVEIKF